MNTEARKDTMLIQDYCEYLWNKGFFDDMHSDMYWSHSFSAEVILTAVIIEACVQGVKLKGFDSFDYNEFFYQQYKHYEDKGLS